MLSRSNPRVYGLQDSDKTVPPNRNISIDPMTAEMSELQAMLEDLDLQEYFNDLVEQGFDALDTIIDIRETDMATLGIKLGHRRKLQREIARRQGHDSSVALPSAQSAPTQTNEQSSEGDSITQNPRAKRRYRRRVPQDPNAPTRPDNAYVAYTKAQRQDPKVAQLPFIEIAKLVGDRWTHLSRDAKDIWKQNAEVERARYKSAVAEYHSTDAYKEYRKLIQSKIPLKERCEDGVNRDGTLSQMHHPDHAHTVNSSTTEGGVSEILEYSLRNTQHVGSELSQGSSTAPASTTQIPNSAEISPSHYDGFPNASTSTGNGSSPGELVIESIWEMISQDQDSKPKYLSTHIAHDDLLSYKSQQPVLSKSFHVQSINPFDSQPRSLIEPILESFLQNVNSIYHLIHPDDLCSYLDSVFEPTLEIPNLTLSVLCICIAIGYQTSPTGAPDMTIMWYENGRRYLDDRNWSSDPTVMQILALISMFHMAERPATSSHYLDAAIRIGEANNFHGVMEEVNKSGRSENVEWLDIWNTILVMNRILVLGFAANNSIIRTLPTSLDELVNGKSYFTTYRGPEYLEATQYRFIRAQSNVATCAFGNLFDILSSIQKQLSQNNRTTTLPQEANILIQKLETWMQSLPNELALPTISGSRHIDQSLLENTIDNAHDARKVEMLHLYSLYFGTSNLLMCPSLQQMVTVSLDQPVSLSKEDDENTYRCLDRAAQSINLCVAFFNVSAFPVFAWLPQCTLFQSSLICVLGILWQRQLLAKKMVTFSQERLDRSNHGLSDALHIFQYCGLRNKQCQRHFLVLQLIFAWLQNGTASEPTDNSESRINFDYRADRV